MATVFDLVTVACFVVLVLAFFMLTDRDPKTLSRMLMPAIVFALANQLGNAGWTSLAAALIVAGSAYAFFVVRRSS